MEGITGSPLFEVAIGVALVWFAAATLCTGVVELVGAALGFKAKHLWRALSNVLNPAAAPTPP